MSKSRNGNSSDSESVCSLAPPTPQVGPQRAPTAVQHVPTTAHPQGSKAYGDTTSASAAAAAAAAPAVSAAAALDAMLTTDAPVAAEAPVNAEFQEAMLSAAFMKPPSPPQAPPLLSRDATRRAVAVAVAAVAVVAVAVVVAAAVAVCREGGGIRPWTMALKRTGGALHSRQIGLRPTQKWILQALSRGALRLRLPTHPLV
jgi:hypothetical protein